MGGATRLVVFPPPPVQAVVQTVDNLLGREALVSWADMSYVDQSRSASLLLDAVEKGAFLLANNLYEGRFSDRAPNIGG